jgi:branched-chain amino acid transport system permease protein
MTQILLFNVTNGLIIGAFYVLMALGLSLILNLSNTINFAHGGFLVIGGYIAYTITPYLGFWGALLVAPPLTAIVGLAVERVLIRPLYGRDPLYSLLLRYTRLGIRIRAGTLDLDTVAALGINVQMLRSLNFAVGIFLAGLSGVLAAGQLGLEPTMGTGLLMPSFIAIIVGGIGSLPGTLAGGLLIGVASGLTAVFFPAASEAVIYVMMAVILLIRPRGLFGEEGMMS